MKKENIVALLNDIDSLVITKCDCYGKCMHGIHSITAAELCKVNPRKKKG